MRHYLVLISALSVILYVPASATILNVPADYSTIQDGINASSDGDTVLVQPGGYFENLNYNGHNVVVGSLFITTGNEQYINTTLIDGDADGAVATFINGENRTAVLAGFTIRNGRYEHGGGIYCHNSSPAIWKNRIINNVATQNGGGIYCVYSNMAIIDNYIANNSTDAESGAYNKGGGIYAWGSDPLIEGNTITNNTALSDGGGICSSLASARIINNIITNNTSGTYGGGIYGYDLCSVICNNVITGNHTGKWGGGIGLLRNCNPLIINNTICDNSSDQYGGAIYMRISSNHVEAHNNILWDNSADSSGDEISIYSGTINVSYTDIEGGWEGEGNIDIDPMFVSPNNNNYHLMSTECGNPSQSPCIDAGHPDIEDSLLDCDFGLGTSSSDLGAYGGGRRRNRVINVPDDFTSIQEAIDFSWNGDTVLVSEGTYSENIRFRGHNIILTSRYLVTGDTSFISSTIIDCMLLTNSIITIDNYEDSTATVCGFTLQYGIPQDNIGGAIDCYDADPVICHNIFKNNWASGSNLRGGRGGAIRCSSSSAKIRENIMFDNRADYGGAIYCSDATPIISHNLIYNNNADSSGGAIFCTGSSPILINNDFVGNAAQWGGGIFSGNNSIPVLINNILWADSAFYENSEIFIDSLASIEINYCDIQDTVWPGQGNISADPLFIDQENGDFHLLVNSPCIDAGDPDSPFDPDTTRADIGAFYYDHTVAIADDISELPLEFNLLPNYPNPFNNSTAIKYALPEKSPAKLEIYNLLGQRITTIVNDYQPAGRYSVIWDASGYASGLYFARLTSSGHTAEIKMLLVK